MLKAPRPYVDLRERERIPVRGSRSTVLSMGARHTRWFLWTRDPELLRAAARAAYEQECLEWKARQQAVIAHAIIVSRPKELPAIRRAIEVLARIVW